MPEEKPLTLDGIAHKYVGANPENIFTIKARLRDISKRHGAYGKGGKVDQEMLPRILAEYGRQYDAPELVAKYGSQAPVQEEKPAPQEPPAESALEGFVRAASRIDLKAIANEKSPITQNYERIRSRMNEWGLPYELANTAVHQAFRTFCEYHGFENIDSNEVLKENYIVDAVDKFVGSYDNFCATRNFPNQRHPANVRTRETVMESFDEFRYWTIPNAQRPKRQKHSYTSFRKRSRIPKWLRWLLSLGSRR